MNKHSFSFFLGLSSPGVLHGAAPEWERSWLAVAMTVMVVPVLFAMSSCCPSNSIRRVPTIRGRVVEAKTNRPIADARLARWFEREDGCLAPGGSDVHSVTGSFLAVSSDKDGLFEWPAWSGLAAPIRSMQWYVYHPGWVAAEGWFNHPRPGLEGYFFGISGVDPWLHLNSHPAGSHLEVTITMEPKDRTAAWEAHFQRMVSLTRYGKLDVDYFVNEATWYAQTHEVTSPIYDRIYEVQQSLGGLEENGKYDRPEKALTLLSIQHKYCSHHREDRRCSPDYLEGRRTFLQHGLESNLKPTR